MSINNNNFDPHEEAINGRKGFDESDLTANDRKALREIGQPAEQPAPRGRYAAPESQNEFLRPGYGKTGRHVYKKLSRTALGKALKEL